LPELSRPPRKAKRSAFRALASSRSKKARRQGRNPGTGETIEIAASRKLGFSPAKQVKDALAA